MNNSSHTFSFFIEKLSDFLDCEEIKIADPEIVYRLFGILRSKSGQKIILFNDTHNCLASIISCNKKIALIKIEQRNINKTIKPNLIVCIGLIKKPAFEEAVYACAALGAQTIIPILSKQVERNWLGPKEFSRLERVAINAREQAKSFWPTRISAPINFSELGLQESLNLNACKKLVFEKGAPKINSKLLGENIDKNIALIFGPEAGFVQEELASLAAQGFETAGLCPTTLRTEDAVTVAVGLLRSLL